MLIHFLILLCITESWSWIMRIGDLQFFLHNTNIRGTELSGTFTPTPSQPPFSQATRRPSDPLPRPGRPDRGEKDLREIARIRCHCGNINFKFGKNLVHESLRLWPLKVVFARKFRPSPLKWGLRPWLSLSLCLSYASYYRCYMRYNEWFRHAVLWMVHPGNIKTANIFIL